jgi:DNA repair protein RecN (Recombination protein N)
MLVGLSIHNIVLIDRLDLAPDGGLTVLTGETGGGKSILLDSLDLALGARADAAMIRHGAEQGIVAAQFTLESNHPALEILRELGLDAEDGEIILRRVVTRDGRGKAFVNDQPVSVAGLRQIGDTLVEIHGQNADRGLINPAGHRALLDAYAGETVLARSVGLAYRNWRAAEDALSEAEADSAAARSDEAYLRHAAEELTALAPEAGEEAKLAAERQLMMNAEKLVDDANEALAAAGGDSGAEDRLMTALRRLERVAERAEGLLDQPIEALERALVETREAVARLEEALARLDFEPGRLEKVETRLFALRAAARKHQCPVDDLEALARKLTTRLEAIETGEGRIAGLRKAAQAARGEYVILKDRLAAARAKAAKKLDKAVSGELAPLMLGRARFSTRVEPLGEASWGPDGGDRVVFEVVTIPNAPPGPLSKIASGGELSRFLLALRVVLAATGAAPTLVFDEVDRGVGGAVADAVGERLSRLAEDAQVLVVTHSPQVAARGEHHWRIAKGEAKAGQGLVTTVEALDTKTRREEIARMLSGARITDEARAAAESLMQA